MRIQGTRKPFQEELRNEQENHQEVPKKAGALFRSIIRPDSNEYDLELRSLEKGDVQHRGDPKWLATRSCLCGNTYRGTCNNSCGMTCTCSCYPCQQED